MLWECIRGCSLRRAGSCRGGRRRLRLRACARRGPDGHHLRVGQQPIDVAHELGVSARVGILSLCLVLLEAARKDISHLHPKLSLVRMQKWTSIMRLTKCLWFEDENLRTYVRPQADLSTFTSVASPGNRIRSCSSKAHCESLASPRQNPAHAPPQRCSSTCSST